MFSADAVRLFLLRFPLDGLRKAAERYGVTPPPVQAHAPAAQQRRRPRDAYVDALMTVLPTAGAGAAAALPIPVAIATPFAPVWAAAQAAGEPVVLYTQDTPLALLKTALAHKMDAYLPRVSAGSVTEVAVGKASAATRNAERSALGRRWRGRYAKHGYTRMCRLYADPSDSVGGSDYREREARALVLEQHVHELLRAAGYKVGFSAEPGRVNTGASAGPQWGVFLYLAIK